MQTECQESTRRCKAGSGKARQYTKRASVQPEQPERQRSDFGIFSWLLALPDVFYILFCMVKKFFLPFLRHWANGWGDLEVDKEIPDAIREAWKKHQQGPEFWGSQVQFPVENVDEKTISSSQQVLHGTVKSPLHAFLPSESAQVPFQVVLPAGEPWAVVVLCPGTADDTYIYRRKFFAEPLLKHGIACILPTMPFYGPRQRKGQKLFYLNTFSDFIVQCYAATMESLALLDWARLRYPKALLGISGMSHGGGTTQTCGVIAQHDLAVVPMLQPTSGANFVTGGLIHDLAIDRLATEGQMSYEDAANKVFESLQSKHDDAAWQGLLPADHKAQHRKCATCVCAAHDAWVTPEWCGKAAADAKVFLDPQARCYWVGGGHLSNFIGARSDLAHLVLEALQRLEREKKPRKLSASFERASHLFMSV